MTRVVALAFVAAILAGRGTPQAEITHPTPTSIEPIAFTHDRDADAGKEVGFLVRALAEAVEPLHEGSFRSFDIEADGRTVFAAEVVVLAGAAATACP